MGLCYAMFTVFAFGTFVKPLQEEFGWSRGDLSFALTMTNIAVVLVSPALGLLIDKIGVKRALIPSVIMMGLCVASMTLLTPNIWHYYALYFLIPFLGAGTLPQSYSRVLIAWFARRRGLTLGLSLSGFGVGVMLVPVFAQMMIENHGWRSAYIGFAIAIFALALPMAVFVLKEDPKKMGLKPDGDTEKTQQITNRPATDPAIGLTSKEAVKTMSFWLILFSFLLVGIGLTSVIAHLVPMLIDRGVSPQTAALCMTSMGGGLIVGRLIAGYLMDYFFAPYVTAFFLMLLVSGMLILSTGTTSWLIFLAAISVGMASGSEISEIAYICSRYFGPKAFGQIYGVMFAAFQFGSAFGAPVLGKYHDKHGDYTGALWFVAALVLLGAILIVILKPYPNLEKKPKV